VLAGAGEVEPVFAVEDHDADGVAVRVYRSSPEPALPVVVFFHGGGWTIGTSISTTRSRAGLRTRPTRSSSRVDYRLAPEHPFPAPPRRLLARARMDRQERRNRSAADGPPAAP
jgi:acetyl esterase